MPSFGRGSRAAAGVTYALAVGLVGVAALSGVDGAGTQVKSVFDHLSEHLTPDTPSSRVIPVGQTDPDPEPELCTVPAIETDAGPSLRFSDLTPADIFPDALEDRQLLSHARVLRLPRSGGAIRYGFGAEQPATCRHYAEFLVDQGGEVSIGLADDAVTPTTLVTWRSNGTGSILIDGQDLSHTVAPSRGYDTGNRLSVLWDGPGGEIEFWWNCSPAFTVSGLPTGENAALRPFIVDHGSGSTDAQLQIPQTLGCFSQAAALGEGWQTWP